MAKAGRTGRMADDGEGFDVVVAGAGLAGLRAAGLMANAGLRVLLADRKRDVAEGVHTTGIFVRRTLEDFALPADCLGPAVRHVTLYSPARRGLSLEVPREEFRVGRMGRLYGRMLSECQGAGVVWSPGTRYLSCEAAGRGGGRQLLRLERGGRAWAVAARFLVGADGARSSVARDLGLDCNREWIVGVEEVFEGVPLSGAEPRFHCFVDPRLAPGYLAWVVEDGEETHVGVGGYARRFDPARALAEFRESLAGAFDFGRARRVERRGGRIPVGGVLRRIANGRGLLVGDAAGAVSPLTAGGLDPCMRLSTLAARVAADFLATCDESALAPYSGARFRSRFATRLLMRRLFGAARSPLLVEAACAAMRVAPLDALARHVFFGRGSFPDVGVAADASLHGAERALAAKWTA